MQIVEALLVTLGLDASGLKQGTKEAEAAVKKTTDNVVKGGKEIESSAKKAEQYVSRVRSEVLKLFAIFSGGRGLEQFASFLTANNAGLGRMAQLTNMSAAELAAWQGVARVTGTNSQSLLGSISSLNNQLQQMALTGDSAILPYLRALGVNIQGANGHIKTANEMLPELADKLSAIAKTDAARARAIGAGLGLSDDMVSVLIRGNAALQDMLNKQRALNNLTPQQVAAYNKVNEAWGNAQSKLESLGNTLMERLAPALVKVAELATKMFAWFEKHPTLVEAIIAGIAGAALVLGIAFAGISATALLVAAAVGAVMAAGVWLIENWDDVKAAGERLWEGILKMLQQSREWLYRSLGGIGDFISGIWTKWTKLWDGFAGTIYNAGGAIIAAVKKVFSEAFGWVTSKANSIWEKITGKKLFDDESDVVNAQAPGGQGSLPNSGAAAISAKEKGPKFEKGVAYFMSQGLSREQAIGLMANFDRESGLRNYAVGDNGQAYGMGQWHADRQANFKKLFGKDITQSTDEEQWQFAAWELNNTERAAGNQLRRAKTSEHAAVIVSKMYERPRDAEGEAQTRAMIARAWDQQLKSGDPLAKAINGATPSLIPDYGAPTAAQWGAPVANNDNSNTRTTHIDTVNINVPPGSDGKAIGDGFRQSVEQDSSSMHAEYAYN